MSKTWSEQILDMTLAVEQGEATVESLSSLLVQALLAGNSQLSSLQSDPELTPQQLSSLQGLLASFQQLQSQLNTAPLDWPAHRRAIQEASEQVRQVRLQAEEGPTSIPFLNRALRHLQAGGQGKPLGQPTRELLEGLPDLEDHLAGLVEQVRDPATADRLGETIAPVLEMLSAWSEQATPEQMVTWQQEILERTREFDRLFSEAMQSELSRGPSGLPIVNLVLMALEQGQPGHVQKAARQCQSLLRLQLPQEAPVQAAAEQLFALLSPLEQGQIQPSPALREALIDQADQLASVCAIYSAQNEILDYLSQEGLAQQASQALPPLLASLLQLAEDYVERRISASALEVGISRLQQLVERIDHNLERARNSPSEIENTRAVLECLDEAGEVLQRLRARPQHASLQELEQLLLEANQYLPELQAGKR